MSMPRYASKQEAPDQSCFDALVSWLRGESESISHPACSDDLMGLLVRNKLLLFALSEQALPKRFVEDHKLQLQTHLLRQEHLRNASIGVINELKRLTQTSGVRFAVIKGLAFSELAYRNGKARETGDIDLLTMRCDVQAIHDSLLSMGYRQTSGASSLSANESSLSYAARAVSHTMGVSCSRERAFKKKPSGFQYAPYVREGLPTVELHDGFHGISDKTVRLLFEEHLVQSCGAYAMPTFNDEATFAFMLANAYENSESFYSNNFDYGITLRDYLDIVSFTRLRGAGLSKGRVAMLLHECNLDEKMAVLSGNIAAVFGDNTAASFIEQYGRKQSIWGASILDRARNPDLASRLSTQELRNSLRDTAVKAHLGRKCECDVVLLAVDGAHCRIWIKEGRLGIEWALSRDSVDDLDCLHQVSLYPLERADYLAFKINLVCEGGAYEARCHESRRLNLDAVLKPSAKRALVHRAMRGPTAFLSFEVPLEWGGLGSYLEQGMLVAHANTFFRHCGEYFEARVKNSPDSLPPIRGHVRLFA